MNKIFKISIVLMALVMVLGFQIETQAARTTRRIRSVSFKIHGDFEIDTKVGTEQVEVSTSAGNYSYQEHEIENATFTWTSEDTPRVKLVFAADEGYVFDISKASQVKVEGATYVSATRQNGSTELHVVVKFPSLANQVGTLEHLNLSSTGIVTWDPVMGAGNYEVRLTRGGTVVGGTQVTSATSLDLSHYMTKAGNYYVKVRAVSQNDSTITSTWEESNTNYVTDTEAKNRQKQQLEAQSQGTWVGNSPYRSFIQNDGQRVTNSWRYIGNEWYYFKENGYAASGWEYINGKWYYLDPTQNTMWKNTITPDGYTLDITGAWIQ